MLGMEYNTVVVIDV